MRVLASLLACTWAGVRECRWAGGQAGLRVCLRACAWNLKWIWAWAWAQGLTCARAWAWVWVC
eukprot:1937521-Alexandrium_andersonii.AAC.1